ncbi:hypothetical protein Pint_32933 [Pistacia integerrima]|uniref:Uncharacterized protein n=1 Tax=Pistacia integerrima TaxID=434235 RepID=A0ACC0X6J0_9ROSI|nr:hypothetical protein Pint_32933 [Pistacia integerrima]
MKRSWLPEMIEIEKSNINNNNVNATDYSKSEEWQKSIYYTLCGAYAFVSLVALVQLLRIQLRVSNYGWTTQKVFHLMNFLVNGLRAILFGMYKSVFLVKPTALEMVLLDLPTLLFFSTYALLVLFWAEIYHQVCIWIYVRLSQSPVSVEVAKLFLSVISFSAALGFLIYGGRVLMENDIANPCDVSMHFSQLGSGYALVSMITTH